MSITYESIINGSDEDESFVVEIPELSGCMADGETCEQAAANAQRVPGFSPAARLPDGKLTSNSIVTIYDPTAGTGGFVSEGDEYIQSISEGVTVSLHGQELNPESYAICKADMLIKGQEVEQIKLGNTLSVSGDSGHPPAA